MQKRKTPPTGAPTHQEAADTAPDAVRNADADAVRNPDAIAGRIVDAILAGRIGAGDRLGEQSLADLFGVSRTLVREALGRLSARGMVQVSPRRGWYVIEPSAAEAKSAFDARVAIETGLVHTLAAPLPPAALKRLKRHVADEKAAIRSGDAARRSYLLGEFHVCLADCAGNPLLADILKDLTARTTLIAALYQSTHDATRSCADHARIVAALEAGDHALAAQLLRQHIEEVANHLGQPSTGDDPLQRLRAALLPEAEAPRRLFSDLINPDAADRRKSQENPR
ncbi:GntR family transcriptional regulator [Aquincola sp. S2]|uniref:GntR family transcriptional regulator n=1 Tax=Pseudaquabacterium terrae TaxID=2732868 RepID=A0ABX2ESI7_9BURK|nr:GntR family transcriptional regulator [Aquabacterium terrae]NRF71593.1 GntR family transcriptional regulator [Aquabacterium terrae]